MASPNLYPAPFVSTGVGPDLLKNIGNLFSGSIFWLSSLTGSDANAGTEPELPKATLASVMASAAAGDVVLCASGHTETIAAAQTYATADVMIIGMGLGANRAKFTSAVAAGVMFTISGARTSLWNCYFPAATAANTARIASTSTEFGLYGSYMEVGSNDGTNGLTLAGNNPTVRDCDFVSVSSRPARAINVTGAISGGTFENILVDGGSYGFSSAGFGITAAATRLLLRDIRLANRADLVCTTTATSYKGFGVRAIDQTGCRVQWAA
jgi:hypothetical protein